MNGTATGGSTRTAMVVTMQAETPRMRDPRCRADPNGRRTHSRRRPADRYLRRGPSNRRGDHEVRPVPKTRVTASETGLGVARRRVLYQARMLCAVAPMRCRSHRRVGRWRCDRHREPPSPLRLRLPPASSRNRCRDDPTTRRHVDRRQRSLPALATTNSGRQRTRPRVPTPTPPTLLRRRTTRPVLLPQPLSRRPFLDN